MNLPDVSRRALEVLWAVDRLDSVAALVDAACVCSAGSTAAGAGPRS